MGNKNKGKREEKKKPKAKPTAAPGRKREDFSQTVVKTVRESTEDK